MHLKVVPLLVASSGAMGAMGLTLELTKRGFTTSNSNPNIALKPGYNALFRFPFFSLAASQQANATGLGNVDDKRYTTNITINGVSVYVAIDTGSTDLWVSPPGGIGKFNDTGIPLDLLYGDGTYGVSGTIGVSPFTFGDYNIPQQAFLHATKANIQDMTDIGVNGLLGLSFDVASASPVNAAIQGKYGAQAKWGQSVLQNIFDQNPAEPNLVAIDLSRTDDLEDTAGGSFEIGTYASAFSSVQNAPKLAQFPKGADRWTTLLQGIKVNGVALPLNSTIKGVPAHSMLALLDTGDPGGILPVYLMDALYSKIPGAAQYSTDNGDIWIIPCNTTTSVTFTLGGQDFPVHPLDLSTVVSNLTVGDGTFTACVSSILAADNWGQGEFEISLGDIFLRNVYSVFNFGTAQSNGPFLQLLSQTNATEAALDVPIVRAKTMANTAPEIDPARLKAILIDGDGSAAGAGSNTTTTAATATTTKSKSTGTSVPGDSDLAAASDSNNGLAASMATGGTFGVTAIVLLATNLIMTLIVAVVVVLNYIRKGKTSPNRGSPGASGSGEWAGKRGKYAPLGTQDELGSEKYNTQA